MVYIPYVAKGISVVIGVFMLLLCLTACKSTDTDILNTLMDNISENDIKDSSISIVAREGKGALVEQNGQRILFLKGTPYEMGYQHGVLLKDDVKALGKRVIDTISVESPGGLSQAWEMAEKFIPERFKEEIKGLSDGAGVPLEEVQAINIFPELFHCSGLVLYGNATKNAEFFHARILDYAVEHGLQDNSVVMIVQPDNYNTFINAGLAGLIGSVTGMNETQVAFGEIGGKGQGEWDGIPMTLLMRMAMEEANTLHRAVNIFKGNPRTCEYFYVISDIKSKDARLLYCTPDIFETLKPGQNHRFLPVPPPKDTLLASSKDRYLEALKRVEEYYGDIDDDILIEILKRPVSMKSNLHNAIFMPKDLKVLLAVAKDPSEEEFQACYQTYHEYNLPLLLKYYVTSIEKES